MSDTLRLPFRGTYHGTSVTVIAFIELDGTPTAIFARDDGRLDWTPVINIKVAG